MLPQRSFCIKGGCALKTVSQIFVSAIQEAERQLEFADAEAARLGAEGQTDVQALRLSIDRASNRLSRALLFHHILSGQVTAGISPVPVQFLLEDIALETRVSIGKSTISLSTEDLTGEVWPLDRELILEVFYNAALASVRHARSQVRLSARIEDGMLALTMEDDGPGFPSLDEESFHERGYGLYVAQHIAALHRRHGLSGRVICRNGNADEASLGDTSLGGAIFTVLLP